MLCKLGEVVSMSSVVIGDLNCVHTTSLSKLFPKKFLAMFGLHNLPLTQLFQSGDCIMKQRQRYVCSYYQSSEHEKLSTSPSWCRQWYCMYRQPIASRAEHAMWRDNCAKC